MGCVATVATNAFWEAACQLCTYCLQGVCALYGAIQDELAALSAEDFQEALQRVLPPPSSPDSSPAGSPQQQPESSAMEAHQAGSKVSVRTPHAVHDGVKNFTFPTACAQSSWVPRSISRAAAIWPGRASAGKHRHCIFFTGFLSISSG